MKVLSTGGDHSSQDSPVSVWDIEQRLPLRKRRVRSKVMAGMTGPDVTQASLWALNRLLKPTSTEKVEEQRTTRNDKLSTLLYRSPVVGPGQRPWGTRQCQSTEIPISHYLDLIAQQLNPCAGLRRQIRCYGWSSWFVLSASKLESSSLADV